MTLVATPMALSLMAASSERTRRPTPKANAANAAAAAAAADCDAFTREVEGALDAPLGLANLLRMSEGLQREFRERLRSSSSCMLPSYNYTLPRGDERGRYLALDVGGSTFRVALVDLAGTDRARQPVTIVRMESWRIDERVRALEGHAFFDWMADRVRDMLAKDGSKHGRGSAPLRMGLAWSFPVEQTSTRTGTVLGMGKGFHGCRAMLGQDLRELTMRACRRRGLDVEMDAIVNDSSAALLSRAYVDPRARMAVVVGTGVNAAVHLPVSVLGAAKFGSRPGGGRPQRAGHVLVNTELSMFGRASMSRTRWDDALNASSDQPDFQPLEQLVGGRYLGELVRLILVEATHAMGLFAGGLPELLHRPYSLSARATAAIELDETPGLRHTAALFHTAYACATPATHSDLLFVRRVCQLVSRRAAAYLAVGIHALCALSDDGSPTSEATSISCSGSVIEKYPGFRATCQRYLDALTEASRARPYVLEPAGESAVVGAAVAVALARVDEEDC
ncbi:MAG: hypothetical protein M1832_002709 [Thelocarpon impressellum]|nr:MAG: hypothetical protein M1832_002709 [Thelocarpon impressellum]